MDLEQMLKDETMTKPQLDIVCEKSRDYVR